MDETTSQLEFNDGDGNGGEYEVETIGDSEIYKLCSQPQSPDFRQTSPAIAIPGRVFDFKLPGQEVFSTNAFIDWFSLIVPLEARSVSQGPSVFPPSVPQGFGGFLSINPFQFL